MKINKKYEVLFKKSKPLFIVVTILTCFMLLFFGMWLACKWLVRPEQTYKGTTDSLAITSGTVHYEKGNETKLPVLYKTDKDGNRVDDFKVCVIGDMHLNDSASDLPLKVLENFIKIDKPDLVVLNGDTCTSKSAVETNQKINQMFERNNQYWTFTMGNHDDEPYKDGNDTDTAKLKQFNALAGIEPTYPLGSSHCIANTMTNDFKTLGIGNNCIRIEGKDNKALKYIFTFDSNKLLKKNEGLVNWYSNTVNNLAYDANNYIITHVPFIQMEYAWNHQDDKDVKYLYGVKHEVICCDTNEDSGLFNAIKQLNKTDSVIFSHDHTNNFAIQYQGVTMQYSLGFAWNMYSSRNSEIGVLNCLGYMLDDSLENFYEGSTDLYINKNKSVVGNVYAQYNGTFNGLEFDMWKYFCGAITVNGHWLTIQNRIVFPLISGGCITYYVFFIIYHRQNKKKKSKNQ